ncbi:MAG: PEP/pyruvate-binding domain-containing protein [Syntrophomonas sp.]
MMVRTFERASTGINGLDTVLDNLRLGDNVVWQVESVDDYIHFVQPFVQNARQEKRRIVYMRFGQHAEILTGCPEIKVYHLDADQGFETFSTEVHNIATLEGPGVFYVFDCLSDLLSTWATDLMIGNFFKVTCPYLFELDTIAYFSILRDRNSYDTIARIRETTQLLLDVYHRDDKFFIHPLKVWNRYSPTMYLPHVGAEDKFIPITSSFEASRLFSGSQHFGPGNVGRKLDYWDRVFLKAGELTERLAEKDPAALDEREDMLGQLCKMIIGRDERVLSLARKYFLLEDLLEIRNRLLGSGFIGGKAVGMLLARKILCANRDHDWESVLETHDSFYIGSDVYYTYLVENECWNLRLEQKKEESYFSAARELKEKILQGIFPGNIQEQFSQMLEYFGQSPIIVRSSSLLEDGFGNAFAGKYDSVFCVNQGNLQERYNNFEQAVRSIYASTMSEDALSYRLQRGLAESDEQMALLVQRVSGSHHGHYFFPDLAGVAMSYNPYIWHEDMDSQAGMMRLVLGLGTRAVERVEDDYPRFVALDKPLLRPISGMEENRKYSQHKVDLLDTVLNDWDNVPLSTVASLKPGISCWDLVAEADHETARRMKGLGYSNPDAWVLTFDPLLGKTPTAGIMGEMLKTLEKAYEYPVDTEFTINFFEDQHMQLNLLQCRPLQTFKKPGKSERNTLLAPHKLLFSTMGSFMGNDVPVAIRKIIYVSPEDYIALPISDKYQVARLVGKLNRLFPGSNSPAFMLIGPGRWGTSTPSLGIPVSFAEICNATVLVEVASRDKGYMPELSYGTHFFQDLVETQIFYVALFPGEEGAEFNVSLINEHPNILAEILPEYSRWQDVIKVVDLENCKQSLFIDLDVKSRKVGAYFTHD